MKKAAIYARPVAGVNAIDLNAFRLLPEPEQICPGGLRWPEGSAALAVVAPVWNIIYSFGLLMGIGGSVLFSTIRGQKEGDTRKSNEFFSASVIGSVLLAAVIWFLVVFFDRPLLMAFGARENTLILAREYVAPIKFAIPLFLFNQMLAAYLRNDNHPALATAIGSAITFIVMLTHFFSRKNTLRFIWPSKLLGKLRKIVITGSSISAPLPSAVPTVWARRLSRSFPSTLEPGKAAGSVRF